MVLFFGSNVVKMTNITKKFYHIFRVIQRVMKFLDKNFGKIPKAAVC